MSKKFLVTVTVLFVGAFAFTGCAADTPPMKRPVVSQFFDGPKVDAFVGALAEFDETYASKEAEHAALLISRATCEHLERGRSPRSLAHVVRDDMAGPLSVDGVTFAMKEGVTQFCPDHPPDLDKYLAAVNKADDQ